MARTTYDAVAELAEVDTTITTTLAPYIESASWMVETHLTPILHPTTGLAFYDDTALELIERYLAAHFYVLRDPHRSSESAGVSESYQRVINMFFDQSVYGQHAKLLDYSGTLAALQERTEDGKSMAGPFQQQFTLEWLGKQRGE